MSTPDVITIATKTKYDVHIAINNEGDDRVTSKFTLDSKLDLMIKPVITNNEVIGDIESILRKNVRLSTLDRAVAVDKLLNA